MKAIIVLLAVTLMLSTAVYAQQGRTWTIQPSYPDVRQPLGTPGSYSNPYTATERYDGSIEIKPSYPDVRTPIGKPGSYYNPYIIQPER